MRKQPRRSEEAPSSITRASRHGPVVLCYTAPEHPYHRYPADREQRFEQTAIDLAVRTITYMDRDDVLEDLPDGEEQGGGEEVDCKGCC